MEEKVYKEETEEKNNQELTENKIINLMHLAKKAGKISIGSDPCERACKTHRSKLIIFTRDASDKTRRNIVNLGRDYNIKVLSALTKEKISTAFNIREACIVSIDDENFAKGIIKLVVN